jgi:hypothetical protein
LVPSPFSGNENIFRAFLPSIYSTFMLVRLRRVAIGNTSVPSVLACSKEGSAPKNCKYVCVSVYLSLSMSVCLCPWSACVCRGCVCPCQRIGCRRSDCSLYHWWPHATNSDPSCSLCLCLCA